jgi:peptidoglycan/LPS O-acetylase OafA/YrhL
MSANNATDTRRPGHGHLPVLDGVRGVAILLVLCVHFIGDSPAYTLFGRAMVKLANYGVWGVDLFFVLSGFLITGILYDSKRSSRYFRDFYIRRTLRIFPLYYAVLVVLFVILPSMPVAYPAALEESARHQAWLWLYASNVYLALHRSWALPYVGHFWSLAVEEQFYLVWPLVVLGFGLRSLIRICAGVAVLALALRIALAFAHAGAMAQLVLTPCRFDALCVGAGLALSVRALGLPRVALAGRWAIGPLALAVLLASAWHAATGRLPEVVLPVRGTLIALTFGALLATSLAARTSGVPSRLLCSRAMRFLGTRSYGLYVFHGIVAYWMSQHTAPFEALAARVGPGAAMLLWAAAGSGVSLIIAAASFDLFEKRFLRLKNRLAPSTRAGVATTLIDAPAR